MVLEWSESKVINLISHVKKHPALYDESSEDYANKEVKTQLWENVAKHLGTSVRDCRRKWTGMCIKYFKLKETGSVSEDKEDWPWHNRISFIDPDVVQNGDDSNSEASTGISSVEPHNQRNDCAAEKPASNKEEDKAVTDIGAVKDMLTSLVSALSATNVNFPALDSGSVHSSKDMVSTTTKSNPVEEGTSTAFGENNDTQANVKANRLFFESLVNDMSSLSLREQYDFKVEVLVLLRSYLLRHKN